MAAGMFLRLFFHVFFDGKLLIVEPVDMLQQIYNNFTFPTGKEYFFLLYYQYDKVTYKAEKMKRIAFLLILLTVLSAACKIPYSAAGNNAPSEIPTHLYVPADYLRIEVVP